MRLVDYLGGTVVATYLDPEQSGYRRDRPGLIKLLRDIETGAVHLVVCEALDRLALDAEDVHSVDVSPCATAHCRKRDVFRDLSAITFRDCDATKLT